MAAFDDDAWRASVAAVRAFFGDANWPDDTSWWAAAAAALEPDSSRPAIVVLHASEGAFAACLAHRCRVETVALLDERYFGGAGAASVDVSHLEGFADTFPGAARLVARRDGSGGQSTKALRGLVEPGAAVVAAAPLCGLAAVRAVRLFCAPPVSRAARNYGVAGRAAAIVRRTLRLAAAASPRPSLGLRGLGRRGVAPRRGAAGRVVGSSLGRRGVAAGRRARRRVCSTAGRGRFTGARADQGGVRF